MIKTILRQIITQCTGTQDIIKKLASCDLCGRKSGLKTVVFLLRLSIYRVHEPASHGGMIVLTREMNGIIQSMICVTNALAIFTEGASTLLAEDHHSLNLGHNLH